MLRFCHLVNTAAMALRYLPEVQQHLPHFQSGSTCRGIQSEKRKGRKSQFLFTAQLLRKTNLAETFSKSRSGTIAHKNKKRITAVTHCQENYSLPVLQPMCSEC
jgi:hypothetical protein